MSINDMERRRNPLPLISGTAFTKLVGDPMLLGAASQDLAKRARRYLKGKRKTNPIKSPEQYGLMQAVAHGQAKMRGVSPEVAERLLGETPEEKRSKFARALSNAGDPLDRSVDIMKQGFMKIGRGKSKQKPIYEVIHPDDGLIYHGENKSEAESIARKHKIKVSRYNPGTVGEDDISDAEDVSREWHGREPKEVLEEIEIEHYEDTVPVLADLEELGVLNTELDAWTIRFKSDRPKLSCDTKKQNLEIIGGDQELELEDDFTSNKNDVPLGYCYQIVYETDKHHLEGSNGYAESYEHFFGEEFYRNEGYTQDDYSNSDDFWDDLLEEGVVEQAICKGYLPLVVYNTRDKKLRLVGGRYDVRDVGITD